MTSLPHQTRSTAEPNDAVAGTCLMDCVTKLLHELEVHYEQRANDLARLTDAKLLTLRTVIDSQAEKNVFAITAADKAVLKAEAATEKRFESVNEFRQTLSDQTKTFISRVEFESLRDNTGTRLADLSSRLDKTDGRSVGVNASWVYLLGGLSALGTLASLIIAMVLR